MQSFVEFIDEKIHAIEPDIEQKSLGDDFFQFSELVSNNKELQDILMDAYTLAWYDKYDSHFQSGSKDDVIKRWDGLKQKVLNN